MIRPNFPLTTADVFALTFLGQRSAAKRLLDLENAALRLRGITNCPPAQAYRIAARLGLEATDGLVDTIALSGVTLDAIADAITTPKETP